MPASDVPHSLRLLCPAKVNLHLRIGPVRADGFHPLLSWMATVGLFDSLTISAADAPTDTAPPLTLECDPPGLPCDSRNLVVRVAMAWNDASHWPRPGEAGSRSPVAEASPADGGGTINLAAPASDAGGSSRAVRSQTPAALLQPTVRRAALRAFLQKRIPVGAGLGGGSSDAARTILALNRLWEGRRSVEELSAFAARFGSDLSFFVFGPSAICAGRGEIVRPFVRPKVRHAVLVLPPIMMPTGDVYRRFDQMKLGRVADVTDEPDWQAWAALDAKQLLACLVNDLEPPAFAICPELGSLRESIERSIGRTVRMSGSGSSLFTLFDDPAEAANAAKQVGSSFNLRAEAVEVCPEIRDDLGS